MEPKVRTGNGGLDSSLSLPRYGILVRSHYHGPGFGTAEHKHPYHSLLYIVSGEGTCFIGGQSHKLSTNTAVLLKQGQRHQLVDKPGKAMVVFVIYFNEATAMKDKDIIDPLFGLGEPVAIGVREGEQIRIHLRRMLHEQNNKPAKFETAILQCLLSIVLQIYRACFDKEKNSYRSGNTSIERVEKVLVYVAERYYEQYGLPDAAAMANLSQRQFTNLCRKLVKKSFVEYVNSIRVQRARELLVNSDVPVSAVAFEVGFEEVSTFYRAFKKYYRVPPLSFRV